MSHVSAVRLTATNHGAAVVLAAGIMLGVAGLALLTQLYQRWPMARHYMWDTGINMVAFILSIGTTAAAAMAIQNGLGQHAQTLHHRHIAKTQNNLTAMFATAFATQGLASVSFAALLRTMNPNKLFQKAILGVVALIATRSIAGVTYFAVAGVYEPSTVTKAAWIGFGVVDILIQIALFILALWMIWPLRMPFLRKFEVSFWFLLCIPSLIASIITRLAYTPTKTFDPDFTWNDTVMIIILLVETNLTIVSAACPSFRNLMTSVSTGFLVVDKSNTTSRRNTGVKNSSGSGSYGLKSMLAGGRGHDIKGPSVVSRGDENETFEPYTAQVKGDANSVTTFASDAVMVRRSVDVDVITTVDQERGQGQGQW